MVKDEKIVKSPLYIGSYIRWTYVNKYLPKLAGGLLLDVGAGQCDYKPLVESKGYTYEGIDIDEQSPAKKGSILDIPYKDNTFDVLICIDVLEHIKDHEKAISELYRVLREGGLLLIHVPNKNQKHILFDSPEEHDEHEREGYTPFDIQHLFYE